MIASDVDLLREVLALPTAPFREQICGELSAIREEIAQLSRSGPGSTEVAACLKSQGDKLNRALVLLARLVWRSGVANV